VRSKNVREICGKPLIAHSIAQALATGLFEHVVISTDSEEIAEASRRHGAEVFFMRPPELATDTAAKLPVIRHAFLASEQQFGGRFSHLVDLDATSPLRDPADIAAALDLILSGGKSIVLTGMPARRSPYFNLVEVDEQGRVGLSKRLERPVARRQDAPKCYDLNASIYAWTREAILSEDSLFTPGTGLYEMPEERSIDIDTELDLEFVTFLMEKKLHAQPQG
jgi:CMP-N,N'-diacetyllegionaminic acid synthase